MKKLLCILIILLLPTFAFSAQRKVFPFYDGLTGGTDGKLDDIDACNANGAGYDLQDKDIAIGVDPATSIEYKYWFDIDSAASESSPEVIAPDNCDGGAYGGNGRWIKTDVVFSASAAPNIEFTDSTHDAGGRISVNSADANDAEMLLGVDDSEGDNTTYLGIDGVDEVIKTRYPIGQPKVYKDANITSADYVVTTQLGSNQEDWNGVTILAEKSSGNFDVVIPDCPSTVQKYELQIEVCQSQDSQVISIVSADTGDNFRTRGDVSLDDGDELDSPGGAVRYMCTHLVCIPSGEWWLQVTETGGTDTIDPTWDDGGVAD